MPVVREILPSDEPVVPSSPPPTAAAPRFLSEWQQQLGSAIRDLPTLFRRLELPVEASQEHFFRDAQQAARNFPLLVPESYLRRMRPRDLADPLLLQVLPTPAENESAAGFQDDPVGDEQARTAPGLLHKYQGRALLIAHGSCAVHCRYCFRRHFPYSDEPRSLEAWEPALAAIRADESLHEIILSGGDPLVLSDRRLKSLLDALSGIPHIRRVRVHSRLPIVLPARITRSLLELFTNSRFQTIFVIHANHSRELIGDCAEAVSKIRSAGVPMLNQAVLLRCVNDSVEALAELCERCIDLGILPYYLHQLDRVNGAAHFEVPVEQGLQLMEQLKWELPGYAVPRYVREEAGASSKTPLLPRLAEGLTEAGML